MKKVFNIIDQDGDIYCAATSLEVAEAIIEKDVADGSLESGIIQETNLCDETDI